MDFKHNNTLMCVAPFATWMALMMLLPASASTYALRTAATAAVGAVCLFAALRHSPAPHTATPSNAHANAFVATVVGLAVCALWVFPEYLAQYRVWCVLPIGTDSAAADAAPSPYAPAVCGWTLTIVRLVGSAFVIAPVEEVFFRHFLYKRLIRRDFWNVSLRHFDASAFCWMVLLFTLEHDRPLAAAMAGAAYGLLAIYRGLPAAIVAHVVTNFALGLHVIARGEWGFW